MSEILIKEDVLIKEHQDFIEEFVTQTTFPWFIQENISGLNQKFEDANVIVSPGFTHVALRDDIVNSDYYNNHLNLEGIVVDIAKSFNVELEKILRIKLNLTTPIPGYTKNNFCSPHIDMEIPHWVMLYYINDSDGDTIIFKTPTNLFEDRLEIVHRITPKKGKCVLFNGLIYHTQSNPIETPFRINLNANVIAKRA